MIQRGQAYKTREYERIHKLMHGGSTEAIKNELERNMWVIRWAEEHRDPLQFCALQNKELFDEILTRGGDPNCTAVFKGYTITLMAAAIMDTDSPPEIVQLLLERGARPTGSVEVMEIRTVADPSIGILGITGLEPKQLDYLRLAANENSPEKLDLLIKTDAYSVEEIAKAARFAQSIDSTEAFNALKNILEAKGAPLKDVHREESSGEAMVEYSRPNEIKWKQLHDRVHSLQEKLLSGEEGKEVKQEYLNALSDFIPAVGAIVDNLRSGIKELQEIRDLLESQRLNVSELNERVDALTILAEKTPLPVVFAMWKTIYEFIDNEKPYLVGATADQEKHTDIMEFIDNVLAFSTIREKELRDTRRTAQSQQLTLIEQLLGTDE